MTGDPIAKATIADLERMAGDESDVALQLLASQRLTDIIAAKITGREKPFLRRIRVGSDVILLDSHDQTELEEWLARGQALVRTCQDHKKKRCQCWEPIREYIWNLQRTKPSAPITRAADLLWDAIEYFAATFARPSRTDSTLETLVATVSDLVAKNDGLPDWLGKRRTK